MPDASPNLGHSRTLRWTDPGVLAFHRRRLGGLDFFRAMARGEIPAVPIYSVLDMRLIDVEPGYCRFECDPGPHMVNPVGGIHGGVYAILADSAAGIAAQSWIEEGSVTRTVRLNVDFLRPLTAGFRHGRLRRPDGQGRPYHHPVRRGDLRRGRAGCRPRPGHLHGCAGRRSREPGRRAAAARRARISRRMGRYRHHPSRRRPAARVSRFCP